MAAPGTGRMESAVRRMFGVKGEVVAPSLSSELLLTCAVDPGNASHSFLRREKILCSSVDIAAVAGQYGVAQIANTSNTHVLVIDEINAYGGGIGAVDLAVFDTYTTLGSTANKHPRDLRLGVTAGGPPPIVASPAEVSFATQVGAVASCYQVPSFGAYVSCVFSMPFVIPAECCVQVGWNTVNVEFHASFAWTEVPITPQQEE